jgi:hypothetical protein
VSDDTRRELVGLLFAMLAAYGYYAIVRHGDDLEFAAKIAQQSVRDRWEQWRAFRRDRKRVLFDAFYLTREASDGRS